VDGGGEGEIEENTRKEKASISWISAATAATETAAETAAGTTLSKVSFSQPEFY